MKDDHLTSLVHTRINKVLAEPFGLYSESGTLDEKATDLLKRPWFDRFLRYAIEARFWGFSLIEIPTNLVGGEIADVYLIPRDNVDQVNGKIHLHSTNWQGAGLDFRSGPLYRTIVEISEGPRYLGLLLNAGKWVIYKRYSMSDWSRHSEKFGMPAIAIKTDTTDNKNVDKKEAFLKGFGSNAYAILDNTDEIQLLEAAKNDPFRIYQEMINSANQGLSKIFLGQTGTTEEKAFVGAAEVHERTLDDYILADIRALIYDVNYQLIPRLILLGYPLRGLTFDYQINREEEKEPGAVQDPKKPGPEDDDEKKLYLSPGASRVISISEIYRTSKHSEEHPES